MPQLGNTVRFQMTGNGPFIVSQTAVNQDDGTGIGKTFSNPTAGNLGALQRRVFTGPGLFDVDVSLQRRFKITEHQSVEVRAEAVNVLNHPSFYSGEQNINSTSFGTIGSTLGTARVMQFAVRYRF